MFERDYILRMFTLLGRALSRVLFFRETKSYDSALLELENASLSLLGMNTDTLERLPVEGLKGVLASDSDLMQPRLYTAGVILKEKGEILSLTEGEDGSVTMFIKSLRLMTEQLRGLNEVDGNKGIGNVDALIARLKEYELPPDLMLRLVDYYEYSGRYGKAEDKVFEMVEGHPETLPAAISFYERLLTKSDDELEKGNLPRDEAETALRELQARLQGTVAGV